MKFVAILFALMSITEAPIIPDKDVRMEYVQTMFVYGENPIYHVGDTFVNTVGIVQEVLYEYYDSCGLYKVDRNLFDYTKYFTESLIDVTFTKSGVYTDTFNGDMGTFRTSVYVYDYGDMNGDFAITVSDAVIMSKLITEDETANYDYLFNADTNNDEIIDIVDLTNILDKINVE